MRLCFLNFPDVTLLSDHLTWGHYVELLFIDNDLERSFYEKQCILKGWTIRELRRQMKSALFLRLAGSQNKEQLINIARKGNQIEKPEDILKDIVFEFLKIPEPNQLSEKDLETRLLDNLQSFLLELGRGFALVGRQYRIGINNEHFKVDLVFYHRFLRCFILIDLKMDKVRHYDIGQMNMYLGYFAKEEHYEGDNPPIGIILSREKDEVLVEFRYLWNEQSIIRVKIPVVPPKRGRTSNSIRADLAQRG